VPKQNRAERENYQMNQLSIIGFIGKDAEVKSLPNGTSVTKFSVATKKAWLDEPSGEWKSKTQWHSVSFYGERFAEKVACKLLKGTHVFVQGELNTREYSTTIQVPNGKIAMRLNPAMQSNRGSTRRCPIKGASPLFYKVASR
jgi:single stranded DNA-binding protein